MKIKNFFIVAVLVLCVFAAPVAAAETEMVKYDVPELGATLELPEEYGYVFTRDMSEDDPAFVELGLSKEQLFESDSVYLEALTENRDAEIIVTKLENDWSEMYYDFNDLTDEELLDLAELCLNNDNSELVMEYADYGVFEENTDVRYLRAEGSFSGDGISGSTVQYVTVFNGEAYTLTFNFIGTNLSDGEVAMTEAVVASADLGDVVPQDKSNSSTLFMVIIVVLIVIIGLLLAVIRNKKYTVKNLSEDLADEAKEKKD